MRNEATGKPAASNSGDQCHKCKAEKKDPTENMLCYWIPCVKLKKTKNYVGRKQKCIQVTKWPYLKESYH